MAYELIKHVITPAGLFYMGQAEQATFDVTLPPEELPGISWFADKINNALVDAAAGEGTILDTKIYFDPGPWYECHYRIVTVGHGSPLAWTPIIVAALVVVGIVIIAWILHDIKSTPWLGIGLVGLGIGAGAFGIAYLIKITRTEKT